MFGARPRCGRLKHGDKKGAPHIAAYWNMIRRASLWAGRLQWLLAVVLVLALALDLGTFSASAVEAQKIKARGERAKGHGRIVFDLSGGGLPYNVRLDGKQLRVMFQRPVTGRFGAVAKALPEFVRTARLSKDGRSVVFDLKNRYRLQTTTRTNSVAIRLYPIAGGAGATTGTKPTARPVAQATNQKAQATTERVHNSQLAPVRRPGSGKAPVQLGRTAKPNQRPDASKTPPKKQQTQAQTEQKAEQKKVNAASGAETTATPSGDPAKAAQPSPETAKAMPAPTPDKVTVAASETVSTADRAQNGAAASSPGSNGQMQDSQGQDDKAMDGDTAMARPADMPGKPAAEEVAKAEPETRVAAKSATEPMPQPSAAPVARENVAVRYVPDTAKNGFSLRFDWPVPVAAAVYRRGGFIWMVFDRAEALDLSPARGAGGLSTASLEQVPVPLAAAARIKAGRGVNPTVRRDGYAWIVTLREQQGVPAEEIRVLTQPTALTGPRVLLPVQGAVEPRIVTDDSLAESVFVVPVRSVGKGVGSDRVFPEFRLLATAQGIVVRSQAEGISVRRTQEGVQITRAGGLIVSGGGPAAKEVRWPGVKPNSRNRIIDIKDWLHSDEKFPDAKNRLQRAIAESTASERGRHRIALAQLYFAHGLIAEAIGTLKLAKDDDSIAGEPAFRLLLGAAAVLSGDFKLAENELLDPALANEPEAALWRGALYAGKLEWESAEKNFVSGSAMLRFYQEPFRSDFALSGARAGVERENLDVASRFIEIFDRGKPTRAQSSMREFLSAEALRLRGEIKSAMAQYKNVISRAKGPVRIRAELARTKLMVAEGEMLRSDAIDQLETLRYFWRGDDIEFMILGTLADYYFMGQDYLRGLSQLRRAVAFYPEHPEADRIRGRMRETFLQLFLKGGDQELTPIKALAIFGDFKDLIPADARGTAIITRLTENLVAVDLLGDADKLLSDQIEERLKGVDRAAAGGRLAEIRLLDRRPKEAITALDKTDAKRLPEHLIMARNRLRARAYGDLGETDAGLDAIAMDPGPETALVRANLHWRAQNWRGASQALGRVAESISADGNKFTDSDAKLILAWSAALALSGDKDGLTTLRRRFDHLMEKGIYSETYRVVANETDSPVTDYPTLVARVRETAIYEEFMTAYRKRLQYMGEPVTKVQ